MKRLSKMLSVLLVLMTICAAAATSVFAASPADAAPVVSSTEVEADEVELENCNLSAYGLSMTVPKLDTFITANSPDNEGLLTLGINASGLVDEGFLIYDIAADNSSIVYVQYSVTPYTKAMGSYNKLTEKQIAEELDAFDITVASNSSFGDRDLLVSEKMGGSTVLHAVFYDTSFSANDTVTDVISTIQNGVSYTIMCRLTGYDTEAGAQRHDQVINSIRFPSPSLGYAFEGGIARNGYGINIFLLIACIVLLILAALLFFFFYRFSAFQKAADSSFNIFGFDMPYSSDHDDNSYSDEDGDGFDDEHDFN